MKKVAKLIYVSMATRVIVDENATEEEIIKSAKSSLIEKVQSELGEHIEEILDDEEVPYDKKFDE